MARPIVHTGELREQLLAAATAVVAERGVAAVSLRDVAARAGTSTTAIYSLFGGKQELMIAVVEAGFQSFAAAQAGAARGGLLELGRAYRDWALAHPVVYSLMFAGQRGGVDCPPTLDVSHEAIVPLIAAVGAAVAGKSGMGSPVAAALAIWGQVHGLVSLELSGFSPPQGSWADAYETALAAISRAYLDGAYLDG